MLKSYNIRHLNSRKVRNPWGKKNEMHVNTETVVMAGIVTVCLRKGDPEDASSAVTHTLTRTDTHSRRIL